VIDIIYKWVFPVLSILLIAVKILTEWVQKNNIISCIIDSIIAVAIILLSVLYIIFLHPRKNKY
jgi:hypothetical protein